MRYIRYITFKTYQSGDLQTYYGSEELTSDAKAEKVKRELYSCGHTDVVIHKIPKMGFEE